MRSKRTGNLEAMKIIHRIMKVKGIEEEMKGWRDYWYEHYWDFSWELGGRMNSQY